MKTNILTNIRVWAIMMVCLTVLGIGNAWGAVVSGTTYNTNSGNTPTGWTISGGTGTGASYIGLTYDDKYIQTDEFCVSSFSSITLSARKYGGPSAAEALITVSWWVGGVETVLGTVAPTGTSLSDYTISSPASVSANSEGYVKISCKSSASGRGSGVGAVTITYTAGTPTPHTVTFNAEGGTCGTSSLTGTSVTLPAATGCPSEGWEFYGWATARCASSTPTAPTIVGKAGDTYKPAADIELHAVYATGEYTRETSAITAGGKYLIVANSGGNNYVMTNNYSTSGDNGQLAGALINETSTNKYHAANIPSNYVFTIVTSGSVGVSSGTWMIKNITDNKYISADYEDFYITNISNADGNTIALSTNTWTITNVYSSNTYKVYYNSSTNVFCSTTSDATSLLIYKETTTPAYWSNPPCCSNKVAVSYNSAGSTHVSAMTFSADNVATCGGASTRRVTVFVTPTSGYLFKAGDELTWTKSSGTIPADPTLVSGPTLNAGKYEFVYEFAQNDNGAGTFAAAASTLTNYRTVCCTDPGLAYGTGSVTKTFGEGTFTNTLTNSNSVAVSYVSSVPEVATVAADGTVTIVGAGTTTITASCVQQTISTTTYCADEASYTLTVNKASISPTLTYSPNSVAVGDNSATPSVGGNSGSGGVTYAITSASPAGCATINTSTGVVTGVAVGSVTVTATIAATDNYNGNTATATVSIIAASYFQNGATVFIQADSKDYSAWKDDACVKAWFNASGAGGAAQTTYWLFDATDTDAGKKLFATVVPASGSLNQVTVQRFDPDSDCDDFWNNNGTLTQASSGGVNTLHSYGSADNNIAWNGSSTTLSLYGSQNSWGSSLATFADQGSGVWTASFSNYAPDATSKDYKIKTSYNNGWIGNTGSNNNATLSGMIVGSTYNVTATLDVTDHSLVMSKEFVKGTVHFDLQGHGLAISDLENVAAGSKISAPSPAPTATGYTFGGWYKEPACTNAWNFASDVVNETMTLYAKWTANVYNVTATLTNVTPSSAFPSTVTYTGSTTTALNRTLSVNTTNFFLPSSIAVTMGGTPLTKDTHYTYNNSTGAFTFTAVITGDIVITATATAKLKSIAITTQPTTRKYFAGESFSSAGAVVTATMGDGSTKAVTASTTWTPPATPLAAGTGLTVTASYTENAINMTATTTIDVYSVTVNKVNEDGDAVSADGVSAGWTVGTKALAASASGASKYVFKQWEVTGASIGSTSSANTTLSNPTANVVVNAVFYKPRVIKWSVGGDDSYETGSPTTSVAYNGTISAIPTAPNDNALGSCATKFMGWSTKSWGSTTGKDDSDYDDLFTTAGGYTTGITDGTKTFYAVFATASGSDGYAQVTDASTLRAGDKLLITSGTTGTIYVLGYQKVDGKSVMSNRGAISTDVTTGVIDPDIASDNSETTKAFELELQGSTGNWNLYDIANSGYLQANGGTSSNLLTYNTDGDRDNNDTWTISIAGSSPYAASIVTTNGGSGNRGTMRYNSSELFNCYSSATQNPIYIFKTNVSYSDYVTLCCTLKPVTGLTVSSTTANSVTLSWTAPSPTTGIDHLEVRNASTDAKIGSDITNLATTTATISGLTECETYSYKIVSVGDCETSSDAIDAQPYSGAKTVTYKYHDDVTPDGSFTTDCDNTSTTLPNPTRTGYTLNGWYTASEGGTKKGNGGASYTPDADITLHAQWSIINSNVTYSAPSNGNYTIQVADGSATSATKAANYGQTITIAATPSSGYRFGNWTITNTSTSADVTSTLLTGDKPTTASTTFSMPAYGVTVTATFIQIHTLTFVVPDGGGAAVTPPATADHGGTITLPSVSGKLAEFSCETFLGWTTAAPDAVQVKGVYTQWSTGPSYKAAGATSDAINNATTFYAVYSRSGGGASGDGSLSNSTITAKWVGNSNAYGTLTTLSEGGTWNYTGYGQSGQTFLQLKDGESYYLQTPTAAGSITSITVNYTAVSSDSRTVYFNSSASKTSAVTHTFDGTYTSGNHDLVVDVSSLDATSIYILANNTFKINSVSFHYGPQPIISHILHCDCEVTQFDLTYDANTANFPGSETSCTGVDDYKWSAHDDIYTICATEPTCAGYKFIGWTTNANGSGDSYDAGEEITCVSTADVTLYAQYERVYTVTFDNQGVTTPITQDSYGAAIDVQSATTPCSGEWAFVGWSETAIAPMSLLPSIEIASGTSTYTPTADKTLYAIYRKTSTSSAFVAGMSGAYKITNGSTVYAGACNNSKLPETDAAGAAVFYIKYTSADGGKYTIQQADGKYLKYSGSSTGLALDNETPYYWTMAKNGTLWRVQSETAGRYLEHDAGTGFKAYNGGVSYTDLSFVAAEGQYYYRTMSCADEFDITFHDNGTTINWAGGYPEAEYKDLADATVVSTFPTASFDGWTFLGWRTADYDESTTAPTASGIYSTGGNALTISSADVDLYPVFTRFEDNEPFDQVNGGDYFIYFLDEGNEDDYGNDRRVYAGTYGDKKRYDSSPLCSGATEFTFTKLANGNWTIFDKTTSKYLYAGEDDWLKHKDGTTNAEWTLTVNGNAFDAYCVGTSFGQISAFGDGTSATFMNYARTNMGVNPAYHRVYLGGCSNRTFTTNPSITPNIEIHGQVKVTSTATKSVKARSVLTVSASDISTANLAVTSDNSAFKFCLTSNGSYTASVNIPVVSNKVGVTPVYIEYTPAAGSTSDGVEGAIVTVSDGAGTPTSVSTVAGDVQGRHLPANFVIAAKLDDRWYALPANCTTSTSSTAGILIEVDDVNDPTTATLAPNYTKYGLREVASGRYAANGSNVTFVEKLTTSPAKEYTLYNGSTTSVQVNAQWSGYSASNPEKYEWILSSDDFEDYTLTSATTLAGDANPRTVSLNTSGVWGTLLTAKSYDGKVRLLPATFYEEAAAQIVEWKASAVVVMYTGTETSATTKVGTCDPSAAQALSTRKLTHGIYELITDAFASNAGKMLWLNFGDTKKAFEIPWVISGTSNAETGHDKHDVVILKNGKLTAVSTKYSFRNVYVYGGGKLKIASGTSLGVNNIILRAGGITTSGIGSSPSATYEYIYPQVELGGTLTSTKSDIKYEYITDYDHWYHLCVPFNATLNTITYPQEYYGDNVAANNKGSWYIKRYAGEIRATGSYEAWKDIEKDDPAKTEVTAGFGYIFWGAPKKVTIGGDTQRQKWGIQRMTMSTTAAAATTAETNNKNISVDSYSEVATSDKPNDQGWNLVGNPYMTNLTGLSSTSLIAGELVHTDTDPWDGKWKNNGDGIRYVTIPDNHFDNYEAKTMSWFSAEHPMEAGRTFFVQIAEGASTLTFATANRAALMPALYSKTEQPVDIETGIVMSDESKHDEVNFWIKDGKTEAYENNADYPKTPNNSQFNIYGVHEMCDLSWIAISPEIAEGSMAIGYQVPSAGEYRLSLSETYVSAKIEQLFVTDHEMSPEITTDLLMEDYIFQVNQAETNNERFTVSIKLKTENQIPTGVGEVSSDDGQSTKVRKLLINDKLYIIRGGQMYDATGKWVREINK